MTERTPPTVHDLATARAPAQPHEPWQHLFTLMAAAVVLFLLCVIVFHALERLL